MKLKQLPLSRLSLLASLCFSALSAHAENEVTLRIADQKGNMRAQLEAANKLQNLPYKIEWSEFPAAAPLAEALNAQAVDIGVIGDAPLLFAEAAGAQVKALVVDKTDAYGTALIVRPDSPIHQAADLKGKTIATNKGSIGHYVALKALASAGLTSKDVTFRYLAPSDAKLALIRGSVNVWATWEPYTAYAETQDHLRVVINGRGLRSGNTFLAATDTALKDAGKRQAIADYVQRLADSQVWAYQHLDAYSVTLANIIGFPPEATKLSFGRSQAKWQTIDSHTIEQQQETADFYFQAGLLPRKFDVKETFYNNIKVN